MIVLRPGVSKRGIDALAFSPDGASLAAPAGADGVMLWTAFTGGAKAEMVKPPVVCKRIAFTPGGTTLVAGNDSLCALDLTDRKAVRYPITPGHSLWFGTSPGGMLVVAQQHINREPTRVTGWAAGEHRGPAWEVDAPSQVWSRPLFAPAGDAFLLSELRRPAGPQVAHRVRRSASTGVELEVSAPLADIPDQVVLSPDGRSLACGTREVIRIYPAAGEWKDVPTITNDSKKHFTGVAYHPSGRYLAATSNDRTVKLYDTTSWALAKTYTWDIGKMRSVCFSPDGALAAAGSDTGKVVVWDVDV